MSNVGLGFWMAQMVHWRSESELSEYCQSIPTSFCDNVYQPLARFRIMMQSKSWVFTLFFGIICLGGIPRLLRCNR